MTSSGTSTADRLVSAHGQSVVPPDTGRSVPGTWFALSALVLSGLTPAGLVAATQGARGISSAWPLAAAVTVLVGIRYAWLVAKGQPRLFELVLWLFTYVFFGLAPLVQMRTGVYPGTTPRLHTELNARTMLVIIIGLAALSAGLLLAGNYGSATSWPAAFVDSRRVLRLTSVSLIVSAAYVALVGSSLFADREARALAEAALFGDPALTAIARAAATTPLLVSFVGLLHVRDRCRRRGQLPPQALLWVVGLLLVVVQNPVSTARNAAGTALLAALVALGTVSRPRRTRIFVLMLPVALVLVFPFAAFARTAEKGNATSGGSTVQVLQSPDFDAFDQLNNTVLYNDTEGATGGRQLLGAALFWVPRSMWDGKPVDTGVLVADFRRYRFNNLSEPLWGELLIDGGLPLVVLGLGGLGFALRRADTRLVTATRRPTPALAVLPFYMILVLRGSLLQSMAGLVAVVACSLYVTTRVSASADGTALSPATSV